MRMRLLFHRAMRALRLQVGRWRDPYTDAARLLRGCRVAHAVDGGAYHGSVSARLAELFPEATVHAFEPQAASFDFLQKQSAANPRIRRYRCALSNQDGEATLHVNAKAFTTSLLPSTDKKAMMPMATETVRTICLDTWAKEQGIETVEFMKLDLQGHELAALQGSEELVARGAQLILTEVNFRSRYENSCLFHEVLGYLHRFDFQLYRLYELINARDGGWRQGDALFARRSLLEGLR
jgi:FkbM family methyltransferase